MRREIEAEQEIDSLAASWSAEEDSNQARLIHRIEDLPRLEGVSGADIDWVVDGIIAEGAMHLITGDAGAGKSTLVSALGYVVSRGDEFLGRSTSKRPVLILDAENPATAVAERFRRLDIQTGEDFLVWGQWVGEDPPAAGGAVVLDWVARCEPKPLLIVDSLIAFNPGVENDSGDTRRYMAQYRSLTAAGATLIILHHIGKSETARDYRGSSDIKASIDVGYKLTNLGDGARLESLELRPFKQRFSVAPVLHLRYTDGIFSVDQAEARKSPTERLCELLKENPGITKTDFEALAHSRGLGRNGGREFLETGVAAETIRVAPGMNNRKLHHWVGKPVTFPPATGDA
jgi:energy-coupling factor transporter ATP-binding protein EcfA2